MPEPINISTVAARGRSLFVILVALCLVAGARVSAAADINIVFLGPADSDSLRGARQGIEEANAQGRFLKLHYTLIPTSDQDQASAAGGSAIVADVAAPRLLRLAAAAREIPIFNVGAGDDALRQACEPNLFHTIPSDAMRSDAEQQWLRKSPGSSAQAVAWHRDFRKYAAAQLNKRYSAGNQRPMTDEAWAAWAAVKLLSDTIARLGVHEPAALMAALRNDLAFDGQKGVDMSFRTTGQLRQPLLLIEHDKIVAEAPVRGIVASGNLDSLGLADCLK